MLILTLSTCTEMATLGLVRDDALLAETVFPGRGTLAQRLLPRLTWLLAEVGLAKEEITAVAVSLGPGAFTGVRIGVATAKAFACWQPSLLVGIPTLEALAYPYRDCQNMLIVPLINARRQQVYTALFRSEAGTLRRETPDSVLSAEPFAELVRQHARAGEQILVLGQLEGVQSFLDALPHPVSPVRSLVTSHALAALATARLADGQGDDPQTLAPIYLRSGAD
jgi:tRNA threonylcarbamoyladenosine biosynthesis protein TsaB